jgi:hypothetical protein
MNWIIWIAILVAWSVFGVGVAYLFGRFISGAEAPDDAGELVPPVLSYLRRDKRGKTLRLRETTPVKGRGEVAGGHRGH